MDIEMAIKNHHENERKWIHPNNYPIINENVELNIRTIETCSKDFFI